MTSSEMAKLANENRRKRLGEKGYSDYMRSIRKKPIVDKIKQVKKV